MRVNRAPEEEPPTLHTVRHVGSLFFATAPADAAHSLSSLPQSHPRSDLGTSRALLQHNPSAHSPLRPASPADGSPQSIATSTTQPQTHAATTTAPPVTAAPADATAVTGIAQQAQQRRRTVAPLLDAGSTTSVGTVGSPGDLPSSRSPALPAAIHFSGAPETGAAKEASA